MAYNKRLKITKGDYKRLESIVADGIKRLGIKAHDNYEISKQRYVWDLFWSVMDNLQFNYNVSDYLFLRRLYDYLNDDNLESALKAILF